MACSIRLSYSSTSITTRSPVFSQARFTIPLNLSSGVILSAMCRNTFPKRKFHRWALVQTLLGVIFGGVQVEMQDGVFGPFLFQLVDGEPLEEFPLAAEVGNHRGDEQTLAETARTTEEVITDLCRRTDKSAPSCPHTRIHPVSDLLEILYSYGIFHIHQWLMLRRYDIFLNPPKWFHLFHCPLMVSWLTDWNYKVELQNTAGSETIILYGSMPTSMD